MCGRYQLSPEESAEIAKIVRQVQDRIRTGEIFPTYAVPVLTEIANELAPAYDMGLSTIWGAGLGALSTPVARRPLIDLCSVNLYLSDGVSFPQQGSSSGVREILNPKRRSSIALICLGIAHYIWQVCGMTSLEKSGVSFSPQRPTRVCTESMAGCL